MLSTRKTFGHDASSLQAVRSAVGLNSPATLRQVTERYVQDVVFAEPIVTADGVALGGHHRLLVRRDGTYRYEGHFRATGFPSYEVAIMTTISYDVPVPGGPPGTGTLVLAAHGQVHGFNEPGERNYSWLQEGSAPLLASQWGAVRRGRFARQLTYDVDWFGAAGDIASFLAQVVAMGMVLGPTGAGLVLAGTAADQLNLEQLILPGLVGVISAGGAVFILGAGAMLPAFVIGAVATASTIKQRHLKKEEVDFANQVFAGRVPFERVILTNLVGFGQRPFTAPAPGGAILVNIGKGFDNPVSYTGKGGDETGKSAAGQLLIHELTHAWQIANESFTPEYYCRALSTAIGTTGGDMSAYGYGPPGGDWNSFGTEQQGSVVDQWFAGSKDPGSRSVQQTKWPPMDDRDNPYYRYIRDNIRTGIS